MSSINKLQSVVKKYIQIFSAVEYLLNEGFLVLVIKAIKDNMEGQKIVEHMFYLLETLEFLLDFSDAVRIESVRHDIFDLKMLLADENKIIREVALNVFTQVFKLKIGRQGAISHQFAKYLIPGDDDDIDVWHKMLGALMFTTVHADSKKDAYKRGIFPATLKTLLDPKTSISLKRNAAKTLTNLAELPECRHKLNRSIKQIMHVNTGKDETLENQLDVLIDTIVWSP